MVNRERGPLSPAHIQCLNKTEIMVFLRPALHIQRNIISGEIDYIKWRKCWVVRAIQQTIALLLMYKKKYLNVLKTYAIGSHQTFRDFVKLPIWGPIRIVIMSNMKKIELCNLVCICQASDFFRGPTKNVSYLRSSEYTFTFHTVGFRSKFFNRGPTGFGTPPPRPHFISKPLSRRVPSNIEHL